MASERAAFQNNLGAVVFYSEFDDPRAWGDALRAELPGIDFRVYPDVGDPADVRTILAWKPPAGIFAPFVNLTLVVNLGAGVDSLIGRDDLPDIPIARLFDPSMAALMKSYVLFAVTRYARNIPEFEAAKRRHEWRYIHPRPLDQIVVGVMGLGALGSSVATALGDLGFDVRGWDIAPKSILKVQTVSGVGARAEFLSSVEILVNMLPLTQTTRGAVDASVFAALPRGAKFINASRGPVVDEEDLLEALRSGQIAGATLDVFEVEPLPPEHPFWSMENVLITPHLASVAVPEAAARDVAKSIRRVAAGEGPLHAVDVRSGF